MDQSKFRRLKVLVAHAEPLLAAGLAAALRQHPDFEVFVKGVKETPDSGEAMDVVVTDYQDGLQLVAESRCHELRHSLAGAKVLVMTTSDREHEVRLALECGVHGYLLPGCAIDELATGVRALGRGSRYMCMAVAQRMAESLTREALTAREVDVLRLLALGHCNKAIARELSIAVGTVKAHVQGIMGKLEASCRTQAASIAAQRGLIDGPVPDAGSGTARPLSYVAMTGARGTAQYA